MMEAGWDPKLGDNTGLDALDMANFPAWAGKGDITELFKMESMESMESMER